MESTVANKTPGRPQDEELVYFEAMDKKLLNQYLNERFGKEVEDVFASVRPRESCRLALHKPTNSFMEPSTSSNTQKTISDVYNGATQTFVSSRRKSILISQSVGQNSKKGVNTRKRYDNGFGKNQSVFIFKRPVQRKRFADWSNLPRVVFYYLMSTMTIENLWQLRLVCKTWRAYIDAEVESLRIGNDFEFLKPSLYERFDCLRSLTISEGPLLDYISVKMHFAFRDLKVLRLDKFRGISTYATEALADCLKERLEELSFVQCHMQDTSLLQLRNMKKLKKLNITSSKISDNTLRDLCHHLTRVQDLTLSNCRCLSENCFESMGMSLIELETLDLSKNPQLFFTSFCCLDGLSKLKQLKMNYCYPTKMGFEKIAQNSSLSSLELTFDPEQKSSLAHFAEVRQSIGLHELIVNTRIDGVIEPVIAAIKNLEQLDSLALRGCMISGRHVRYLCQEMVSARNFISLTIQPTKCFDNITSIPEITFLQSNLKELRFPNWHGIKNHFLEEIVASCPELRILHIQQCSKLTNTGVKQLVRLPCLEELDISSCSQLTHKGIGSLQRAPALKRLFMRSLHLVEDSGVYGLKRSRTIEELDVSGCDSISFSGLGALVLMPSLQILYAKNFAFLHNGKVLSLQSRAANPRLRIRWVDHLNTPKAPIL